MALTLWLYKDHVHHIPELKIIYSVLKLIILLIHKSNKMWQRTLINTSIWIINCIKKNQSKLVKERKTQIIMLILSIYTMFIMNFCLPKTYQIPPVQDNKRRVRDRERETNHKLTGYWFRIEIETLILCIMAFTLARSMILT